jgi:hypothetical protein
MISKMLITKLLTSQGLPKEKAEKLYDVLAKKDLKNIKPEQMQGVMQEIFSELGLNKDQAKEAEKMMQTMIAAKK